MKIIFVSNISWSLFNFRRGLMLEFKNRGHEVIFCSADDDYTLKLAQLGFRYIPISLDRKGTNILRDLRLLFSLIRIFKKEKPDWVLQNSIKPNIYGTIAGRITGNRCINTVSGLGYLFIRKTPLSVLIRMLYGLANSYAYKVFFQNKDDLKLFLELKLIDPDKCGLVPGSGVNTDYFKPCGSRNTNNGFVFLYLGRLLWDKGIGELIDSTRVLKKQYPLMKVNLLGMVDSGNPAGINRSQIEKWVQEGIIEYLGETADVRSYLEDCDCVVLPSYREGIPRTLLEASAMELPVISTDVVGCRAVVEDEVTGFLVKVKDSVDLTKAMDKVMRMTELQRKEMGQRGRAKVIREYSERLVIEVYCSGIGA